MSRVMTRVWVASLTLPSSPRRSLPRRSPRGRSTGLGI